MNSSLSSTQAGKKTWMPKAAGIINIINGIGEILGGFTIIGLIGILPIFKDSWLADGLGLLLIIAG